MPEWKDLKEEFPTDRTKLYLVRSIQPALDSFTLYYLCQLAESYLSLDGRLELSGMSCNGRRFRFIEPNKDKPKNITEDLFVRNNEEVQIHWREIEK